MDTGITTKAKHNSGSSRLQLVDFKQLAVWLIRRLGNWVLQFLQKILFRKNPAPERILIFRTGSFGDSICAIPAICAIRKHYPNARLDLLTNTGHADKRLVSLDQLIEPNILDRIINYQRQNPRSLASTIRKHRYDLVIQLPQYNTLWSRLVRDQLAFRFFGKIPAGFGWQWDGIRIFRKAQELNPAVNERLRLLQILKKNGIPPLPETHIPLCLNETDRGYVESRLPAGKPLLAIVPGAKRPQNRWPAESFRAVGRHFSDSHQIVLLGGPDDRDLAAEITRGDPEWLSLCGELSPIQNAWVLKKCQIVLSNDTGLMHLAYSVNAPLVALFSARDLPGRWFPPERPNIKVIRRYGIPCSICWSESCADNICMQQIEISEVLKALATLANSSVDHSKA